MERVLYHGSQKTVSTPVFGGGKNFNDYGPGFYCTESADMAREWASARERDGFVNKYRFHEDGLQVLDLQDPAYGILHWLAILLENRRFDVSLPLAREAMAYLREHFLPPYTEADVIIGYRADDSYFSFAQDFLNGAISVRQLASAMHLGKLGEQIMIRSEKAFGRLAFTGYEIVDHRKWFLRRQERDLAARRAYFDAERFSRRKGDLFITHILEEEMQPDDARLR